MDSKNSENLSEIVEKAKKKDSEALSELYSCTHNMAYFTAVSILKNEQDALDVVQNSYITVFGKLDELEDNAAFLAWLKRIVANNCKNMLKRKNPQLFGSDEEETNTLENMEEQDEDFLPQAYIEQQSKREQIMQIINQLSDAQKATILLFYYNQLSVHEIAETMECTESTVTSRISYAKKHIKSEVEKLEKKGDKLYAMAPVPFLTKLFTEEAQKHIMSETAAKTVFSNAVAATTTAAAVSTTGATIGAGAGIFAKFAALSTIGKVVAIGVAATVLTGGGIAGVAIKQNHDRQVVPAMAVVSSSSTYAAVSSNSVSSNLPSSSTAASASSSSTSSGDQYKQMADKMKAAGHSDAEIAKAIADIKAYYASQGTDTGTTSSKPATTSKPSTSSKSTTSKKPSTTTSKVTGNDYGANEGPIGGGDGKDITSAIDNNVAGGAANPDPAANIS